MDSYLKRVALILWPGIIVGAITAVVYSAALIVLFNILNLPRLNEDLISIWLPFVLPALPLLIWVRPRTKTLAPTEKGQEPSFGFLVLFWLFSAMLTLALAGLTLKWSGEKLVVDAPEQVLAHPHAEYFEIKQFSVAKSESGLSTEFSADGRSNGLRFNLFIASPLYSGSLDNKSVGVWLGTFASERVSNSSSDEVKQTAFDLFFDRTIERFNSRDHASVEYFERVQPGEDLLHFAKAIGDAKSKPTDTYVVLKPVFEPFADRLKGSEAVFLGFSGIAVVIGFLMLAFVKLDPAKLSLLARQRGVGEDSFPNRLKNALNLAEGGTSKALITVLIVMYVITFASGGGLFSANNQILLELGGNFGPMTMSGEWWRLFTSIWLHNGIAHLAFNCVALFAIGSVLEPIVGRRRYLICFVSTGILASVASLIWNDNTLSVGASGGIYGLFGVLFALLSTQLFPREIRLALFKTFGTYCGIGLLLGISGAIGNIDNAAHFGGLFAGYLGGFLIYSAIGQDVKIGG